MIDFYSHMRQGTRVPEMSTHDYNSIMDQINNDADEEINLSQLFDPRNH